MRLIKNILTNNGCVRSGRNRTSTIGLILHSIGCPQPSAEKLMKNYNVSSQVVCVHAFIEPDGDVYQTMEWSARANHCGSGNNGSCNNTHIGVEMTEPSTISYTTGANWVDKNPEATKTHVLATYQHAVELFAYLSNMYKLDPLKDGVIMSHSEACKKGLASNHGDVEHLWNKFGLTMNKFRTDVKAKMNNTTNSNTTNATPSFSPISRNYTTNDKTEVKKVQTRLTELGYDTKGIDGIFGKNTEAAVIEFQAINNLTTKSGFIDLATYSAIMASTTKPKKEVVNTVKSFSSEEMNILYKIVEAEAGGEDDKGKRLVVHVIKNRLSNKGFPNTIKEIVFQANQFQPIKNGAYDKANPSQATKNSVNQAVKETDISNGSIYFTATKSLKTGDWFSKLTKTLVHGGHSFFK